MEYESMNKVFNQAPLTWTISIYLNEVELRVMKDFNECWKWVVAIIMKKRNKIILNIYTKLQNFPRSLGINDGRFIMESRYGNRSVFPTEYQAWEYIATNELPSTEEEFVERLGKRIWLMHVPLLLKSAERLKIPTIYQKIKASTANFVNLEVICVKESELPPVEDFMPVIRRIFNDHPANTYTRFKTIIVHTKNSAEHSVFERNDSDDITHETRPTVMTVSKEDDNEMFCNDPAHPSEFNEEDSVNPATIERVGRKMIMKDLENLKTMNEIMQAVYLHLRREFDRRIITFYNNLFLFPHINPIIEPSEIKEKTYPFDSYKEGWNCFSLKEIPTDWLDMKVSYSRFVTSIEIHANKYSLDEFMNKEGRHAVGFFSLQTIVIVSSDFFMWKPLEDLVFPLFEELNVVDYKFLAKIMYNGIMYFRTEDAIMYKQLNFEQSIVSPIFPELRKWEKTYKRLGRNIRKLHFLLNLSG